MALIHRKNGRSPGWVQSVVFNAVMLLTPFLAANAVSGLFASQNFAAEPSIESIQATRDRIDTAFAEIVPRGVNPRAYWADLVDQALRDDNLPAARGFLVAAPRMLSVPDRNAIAAAARDDPFGTEDQKLLRAAVLFLPSDVRSRYERKLQPLAYVPNPAPRPSNPMDLLGTTAERNDADDAAEDAVVRAAAAGPSAAPIRPRFDGNADRRGDREASFSLLGTFEDLSRNSRRWLQDPRDPAIELRLTGLGLLADDLPAGDLDPMTPADVAKAASVLRSALRANRLQPGYVDRLERGLDGALPGPQLRLRLSAALEAASTPASQADQVAAAFRETLSPDGLDRFLRDARQISAVAEATSSVSTVALIEHVRDGNDLRRLRAVVDAGNDRATALETRIGEGILDMAHTGVAISRYTVFQVVGLAAALLLLFWQAASAVQREMRARFSSSAYG